MEKFIAFSGAEAGQITTSEVRGAILEKLTLSIGKDAAQATKRDWYTAAALALRDRIVERWLQTDRRNFDAGRKHVCYMSLEFLIGRLFTDALTNLGVFPVYKQALEELGLDFAELREFEADAALGNGGLGRLAACFMESMSTLDIPATGYGIRYEHGLFRQIIVDGRQQEFPDEWLAYGNPWEFQRPETVYSVSFGGQVSIQTDDKGHTREFWRPSETVRAIAYDTPIVGWRGRHINALRLWSAKAADPLRIDTFNAGDYQGAVAAQTRAEAICKFLYPSDETPAGRELRLRQEYFFVSASLQDILANELRAYGSLQSLPSAAAIQLNDTHPSLAVAEMMRLLIDIYGLRWDNAWDLTTKTLSYTNHTLLPEALETWPVALFEALLPRHLQIIYRINALHLDRAEKKFPNQSELMASVSLIEERGERRVRMGQLAFVGSHRVNGVSAMHTELMKQTVFADLHGLYPDRITNKTNGITFRRWLMQANPALTSLLREVCEDTVLDDPNRLGVLETVVDDSEFQKRFTAAKRANKTALAKFISSRLGLVLDPESLFDVHIKRIHEYKRQLLNIIETIALYQAIKDEPNRDWVPRVKLFAGKSAASYHYAKLIIKLINDVAGVINGDASIRGLLRVAFLPDYNISLAERIIPAANLSEQISTAGMEASGTGNMKFALNGALTIGTLDGANIEIKEHVGADNIFIFGLTAEEVIARRKAGLDATDAVATSLRLRRVIEALERGDFSPDEPGRFHAITHALRHLDHYMVSRDFDSYYVAQRSVDRVWRDPAAWTRHSILNVARVAWFSSDRTIAEYASDIWHVPFQMSEA
ncbi:glycogen/starch/alpha-glucan phosphorylase [Bradyrhizobium prioriisuperbiae]|uniref:glycogen/starch/alpha-glucan phosphorylase n=1 Tax=Bradyrhizobium prioriisuperbiae TaxID=2854389 RepID=UPI0028E93E96|nr:glycogen/starch/alpha-glucan phosphorylase [Bradyrhizobium prioritasuperba]